MLGRTASIQLPHPHARRILLRGDQQGSVVETLELPVGAIAAAQSVQRLLVQCSPMGPEFGSQHLTAREEVREPNVDIEVLPAIRSTSGPEVDDVHHPPLQFKVSFSSTQ